VGLLSFQTSRDQLSKPYSEETARLIDEEARTYVAGAYQATLALLREKRELVEGMAQALLSKEVRRLQELRRRPAAGRHALAPAAGPGPGWLPLGSSTPPRTRAPACQRRRAVPPAPQVLALEDVEGLLGKRPYESAELRNIDRFRRALPGDQPRPEQEAGEGSEGAGAGAQPPEDGPQGGAPEPAEQPPAREPGIAVAT
jgi:hypothetical protein